MDAERRSTECLAVRSIFGDDAIKEFTGKNGCHIVELSVDTTDLPLNLRFELPLNYPSTVHLSCTISCRSLGPSATAELLNLANVTAISNVGEESILVVFEAVKERFEVLWESERQKTQVQNLETKHLTNSSKSPNFLGRRLLYSHHIIGKEKRACIKEWAIELDLSVYLKIGWPGLIVVEGDEIACQEYVSRLMRLRWKQFGVRAEETILVPDGKTYLDLCTLPRGFIELGENEMSVLGNICRQAGLTDLFLSVIK